MKKERRLDVGLCISSSLGSSAQFKLADFFGMRTTGKKAEYVGVVAGSWVAMMFAQFLH